MKKLLTIPILVLALGACTPKQIHDALATQRPPKVSKPTTVTSFTIPQDTVARWECPAPVPPLYLNTAGYNNLTPADRAKCWPITPHRL